MDQLDGQFEHRFRIEGCDFQETNTGHSSYIQIQAYCCIGGYGF